MYVVVCCMELVVRISQIEKTNVKGIFKQSET